MCISSKFFLVIIIIIIILFSTTNKPYHPLNPKQKYSISPFSLFNNPSSKKIVHFTYPTKPISSTLLFLYSLSLLNLNDLSFFIHLYITLIIIIIIHFFYPFYPFSSIFFFVYFHIIFIFLYPTYLPLTCSSPAVSFLIKQSKSHIRFIYIKQKGYTIINQYYYFIPYFFFSLFPAALKNIAFICKIIS